MKKSRIKLAAFSSFEEANEFDLNEAAKLNPLQHLANVTKLIEQIYAIEIKKPMNKKLYFSK